jgi:hypothetical protein
MVGKVAEPHLLPIKAGWAGRVWQIANSQQKKSG